LDFLRFNQEKIRSEVYQGIVDAAIHETDLSTVGSLSILPSSFKGGPREMWQLYQDAMAIVRYCGKPDLFITMTCNPLWTEIITELLPGQTAQDRPELVARVFKLKLNALLHDLMKNNILGRVVAYVYVIEFQKRGLPHAHILLILELSDKPLTPADIDSIVCAEIPSQTAYPELYDTVMSTMLHGPCGTAKPIAPCMEDGICRKGYPKDFSDETLPEVNGYPVYRRRDDGVTVHKHGFIFTNAHVVPYNPYLSAKYNCHINVEIATSITAVKYLFKYVYKGHDRASIRIVNHEGSDQIDEISEYLDSRYVSAAEACWRIIGFRMHQHSPSVTRLQLHLPEMQQVRFNPETETAGDIIQRPDVYQTTLNAFFDTCRMAPEMTEDILYPDFPSKFTWDPKSKVWNPRRNNHTAIGRVTFCPPSAGERYYLRMLLYTVRGPCSFEALKEYNSHVCPMSHSYINYETHATFQGACAARGLLEGDNEWDQCLEEAGLIQTGAQLRQLFVSILLHNNPLDPRSLYSRHLRCLSDDCRYKLRARFHILDPNHEQIENLALQEIDAILQQFGKSLSDYHLPEPSLSFDNIISIPQIIAAEMTEDPQVLLDLWGHGYQCANVEQKLILDMIRGEIASGRGGLFFIDGPGGTGKTFVENLLLDWVRGHSEIALAVASSGIASILLHHGRTSHSRFHIPIDIQPESVCAIPAQSTVAELFRRTKLIVWDEISSQHRYCFEAVDRTLKDLHKSDEWFGGIPVVFAGPLDTTFELMSR
jgi:hypothetical protein